MGNEVYEVSLTGVPVDMDPVRANLLVSSAPVNENLYPTIRGLSKCFEGNGAISVEEVIESFKSSGLQASNLGKAAEIIRNMLRWRLKDEALTEVEVSELANDSSGIFSWAAPEVRLRTRATIFLSFTSNMISSGLRDCLVYLAKNKLVDCFVSSAGGVEEDIIKCLGSFVLGSFADIKGKDLRSRGWNRIGNIYVPNENYVKFEEWLQPILEAAASKGCLTPSELIRELGMRIDDESSLLYWCAVNEIPVFCPNITDGALGDNIYFFNQMKPDKPVRLDVCPDIVAINNLARHAKRSGIVILGGGSPKHHVCNANLMRNGADYAVYINTAHEFDGCDSGAAVDEAISWGKIKHDAPSVKVHCDASIAFPLLVATVFRDEARERTGAPSFILRSPYV